MAEIVLTPEDLDRIEEIIIYLDPATYEALGEVHPPLSQSDREFVVTYMRRRIRSALEIELMARCVAGAARSRNLADDRGVDDFMRSQSWLHNFGVTQTADEYFTTLSIGHANRLTHALEAMILIAQDRLFDRVSEEYERLLKS
jgi:hypothetical protein